MTGATTPKLRFPGFKDPWKPTTVSTLLEKQSVPVDVDLAQTYRQIGVRSHGKGIFHKDAVTGAELGDKRVFHVVPNALVVNIVFAWEQAVALTSDEESGFIASHRFPMFTEKIGKSYLPFLRHMFLTKRGKLLLEMASPGGAGRNKTLGQQEFLKLKPVMPIRAEQKKIADALDAVDAKLAALAAKRAALERFKSGLMQKLFSQQLRFTKDDGQAFPDWQEKRLGDIVSRLDAGTSVNSEDRPADTNEVGVLKTSCVAGGRFSPDENKAVINANEVARLREPVSAASIIISRMNTPALVGANAYIAYDFPKLYLPDRLWAAKVSPRHYAHWVGYFLENTETRNVLRERATGTSGSMKNLTKNDVLSLPIAVPHPDEQRKIAHSLSAMDAKIQAVTDQATKLQTFKKGLLQQMLV